MSLEGAMSQVTQDTVYYEQWDSSIIRHTQERRHGFEGGGVHFLWAQRANFLGPPHILQGPPHFLGGSFQNVGGPKKVFSTVV